MGRDSSSTVEPISAVAPVRVFISHSAKDELTQGLLDALVAGLKAEERYDLLLDHLKLRPGDNWRQTILGSLDYADAAVVILSQDALDESYWVDFEVTTLDARKRKQPDFTLIPVYSGIGSKEAKEHSRFKPIQFTDIQKASVRKKADIEPAVQALIEVLAEVPSPDSPVQRLANQMLSIFGMGKPATLADIARGRLDLNVPVGDHADTGAKVAMKLVELGLCKEAVPAMMAIAGTVLQSRDKAYQMIDLMAAARTDPAYCAKLREAQLTKRSLFINGSHLLLARASAFAAGAVQWQLAPFQVSDRVIELTLVPPPHGLKDLIDEARKEIATRLGGEIGPDDVAKHLKEQELPDWQPFVVVINSMGTKEWHLDPAWLRSLNDQLPRIVVVVLAGPDVPEPYRNDPYMLELEPRWQLQAGSDGNTRFVESAFVKDYQFIPPKVTKGFST